MVSDEITIKQPPPPPKNPPDLLLCLSKPDPYVTLPMYNRIPLAKLVRARQNAHFHWNESIQDLGGATPRTWRSYTPNCKPCFRSTCIYRKLRMTGRRYPLSNRISRLLETWEYKNNVEIKCFRLSPGVISAPSSVVRLTLRCPSFPLWPQFLLD